MSGPFSYAQAASKAPAPAQQPVPSSPANSNNAKKVIMKVASGQNQGKPSSNLPQAKPARDESLESPIGTNQTEETKTSTWALNKADPKADSNTAASTAAIAFSEQPHGSGPEKGTRRNRSRRRSVPTETTKARSDRSSSVGRSTEPDRGQKGKKPHETTKDDHSDRTEIEEKPATPVQLTPAPVPAVNPWHKRATSQNVACINGDASRGSSVLNSAVDKEEVHQSTSKKVPEDSQRDSSNPGQATKGNRAWETEEKKPSAQTQSLVQYDPTSWPTLAHEATTTGQQQQQPQQSKPEQVEGGTLGKKKQWKKVELDRNVYRNPNMWGRSRGRGVNRGGRDASGRGDPAAANNSVRRNGKGNGNENGGRHSGSPTATSPVPSGEAWQRNQSDTSIKDGHESFPVSVLHAPLRISGMIITIRLT